MNSSTIIKRFTFFGLFIGLCLQTACTHILPYKVGSSALPVTPSEKRISLEAALVIDEALLNSKFQFNWVGDTYIMTFGPMLSAYSRDVTQHAFRNVVVHSTVQSAANTADLILCPKFMKFEYSGNDKHLMVLEWTAKDKSGKNIVWFSTVKGQADSKGQSRADLRKRQQILVDDLSEKTLKAFLESPELKRIAAQLKESNPPLR